MPAPSPTADAFRQLDDALLLDPAGRERAIATHHEITERLKEEDLIISAFLQGSFARKTMIDPLRDIDKVVILKYGVPSMPGSSRAVAERFATALRRHYPGLKVEVGKHSVTIDFGEHTFEFDVVPAYDLGDDVLIIDTKTDGWKRSNTRTLIKVVQERNGACNGRWIFYVRAAKLFVREQLDGAVPGLHVEAFAYAAITGEMDPDEALAAILREGARCLAPGGTYTDPTGCDRLDLRLDPHVRQRAHAKFEEAARSAQEAVAHRRSGEHQAAIAIWHQILGDCFPKPDERAALQSLGRGAGLTTVVTKSAPVKPTPTRAWRAEA